jgi:hypothetical protein
MSELLHLGHFSFKVCIHDWGCRCGSDSIFGRAWCIDGFEAPFRTLTMAVEGWPWLRIFLLLQVNIVHIHIVFAEWMQLR